MTVMTIMMMINVVMTMLTIALTKVSPPSIWIALRSRNKWAARNSCQHKSLLITQIICWLLVVVEENWKRAAQLDGQFKRGKLFPQPPPKPLANIFKLIKSASLPEARCFAQEWEGERKRERGGGHGQMPPQFVDFVTNNLNLCQHFERCAVIIHFCFSPQFVTANHQRQRQKTARQQIQTQPSNKKHRTQKPCGHFERWRHGRLIRGAATVNCKWQMNLPLIRVAFQFVCSTKIKSNKKYDVKFK